MESPDLDLRDFGIHIVQRHTQNLKKSLLNLEREFRYVYTLKNV